MTATLAHAARWYVTKKHWSIFPLAPRNKIPLGGHGVKDASNDPATIAKWWTAFPDANIGLAMGERSGLLAVDVDGEAGAATLADLERQHGSLPSTVEQATARGRHLLFKLPADVEIKNSASKIGRGIDVRAEGGYVVVAPSIHPSGTPYRWMDGRKPNEIEPAEPPSWLIDLIVKPEPQPHPTNGAGAGAARMSNYARAALADELAAVAAAPEGQRNDQLNRSAFSLGTLIGAGMIDRGVVERSLAGATAGAGLDSREATATIKSGIDGGIQHPREIPEQSGPAPEAKPCPQPGNGKATEKPARGSKKKKKLAGRAFELATPEPWPEPVDPAELLDDTVAEIKTFVVLPPFAAEAAALWAGHTHCFDCFGVTPRLEIDSPVVECGKTRLLSVLECIVARPLLADNVTCSIMFRLIDSMSPSVLLDEADSYFEGRDELRGLVNSGHKRGGKFFRSVGDDHEPRQFSTWAPLAVAHLRGHKLHPSITSRSIRIHMRRRRSSEPVAEFSLFDEAMLERLGNIGRRWARLAEDHGHELRRAKPEKPPGLRDRTRDNWHPLLALADLAENRWAGIAREAAVGLSGGTETDAIGLQLLRDIRDIFGSEDALSSEALVSALNGMEGSPWPEWKGKPLTKPGLALLLSDFSVAPTTIRFKDRTRLKGYTRAGFKELWETYVD